VKGVAYEDDTRLATSDEPSKMIMAMARATGGVVSLLKDSRIREMPKTIAAPPRSAPSGMRSGITRRFFIDYILFEA
jgi:hypothetical protein